MLIRFDGKRVIVAGAARGIGRAITRAFAATERGHRLRPAGRRDRSGRAHQEHCPVDVTDPASIDKVVAAAGGRVDVLVYVAGGVLGQAPKPWSR
jgi:3-oxoacyl-[acyl-carrier protein] reductase